jgi:hypothetical protein
MVRLALLLITLVGFSTPALACRDEPDLRLSWLSRADLVLVGHVSNYRVVPDFHEVNGQVKRSPDFARIDVRVGEVLQGAPPDELEVTWDTSWFELPKSFKEGSYLIALHAPGKHVTSPARAKSWTILSPVCERSFLVPSSSQDAAAIRKQLLDARGNTKISRESGGERLQ